jgi:CRP/FNR family cyclic AMP-dependent transcriptional regulator
VASVSRAAPVNRGTLLASVPLLAGVPERGLDELATTSEVRNFSVGARLVAELETGEEAFIILEGKGRVTVGGMGDEPPMEVGEVATGDCVGEMALFTGELRSATVEAKTNVTALVLERNHFLELMARHPSISSHLAHVIGERLRDTEKVLATVLDPSRSDSERREALRRATKGPPQHKRLATAVRIAWMELVASHRRELPFLMLISFVGALSVIRASIITLRHFIPDGASLEDLLRLSYVGGLLLLCGSGTASLLYFRPLPRRVTACLFGAGMALLFNALPVLLTFDLFYQNIYTPDPNLQFSVETLYRRAEGAHVVVVAGAFLLQLVYLQRFYRRIVTLISLRASRRLGI